MYDIVPIKKVEQSVTSDTSTTEDSLTQPKAFVKQNSKNSQKNSDRDADSMSNRSLLANALETAAQTDVEKAKLAQYKQKIELINSEESKLHELRAKIKELSFAKGKRDAEQIRKLQAEATQTANRINTYDRQLLNLESKVAVRSSTFIEKLPIVISFSVSIFARRSIALIVISKISISKGLVTYSSMPIL